MSKEQNDGAICKCGQRITFAQYHWPHCTENPANIHAVVRQPRQGKEYAKGAVIAMGARVAAKLSLSGEDKPIRKKRKNTTRGTR